MKPCDLLFPFLRCQSGPSSLCFFPKESTVRTLSSARGIVSCRRCGLDHQHQEPISVCAWEEMGNRLFIMTVVNETEGDNIIMELFNLMTPDQLPIAKACPSYCVTYLQRSEYTHRRSSNRTVWTSRRVRCRRTRPRVTAFLHLGTVLPALAHPPPSQENSRGATTL